MRSTSAIPRTLLGPEHRRRARRAGQWVGDIAGNDELDSRVSVLTTDMGDLLQIVCVRLPWCAGGVEEYVSERREHAGTAVGAGATTECQHDPAGTEPDGLPDGFTESGARRRHRGQHPVRQGGQPAAVGDLDDGGPVTKRNGGRTWPTEGIRRVAAVGPKPRRQSGGDAAVAAVCQRKSVALHASPGEPGDNVVGDLDRGQAAFELVRGDQGTHQSWPARAGVRAS